MADKKKNTEKRERGRPSQEEYRAGDLRDSLQNEPVVTWTQDVYAAQEDVFAGEWENL